MPIGRRVADLRFAKKPVPARAARSSTGSRTGRSSAPSRTGSAVANLRSRLHRRRGARARRLPLLPRHGRAAQADLRADRDHRHLLHPPRRRHRSSTPWACPSPAPRSRSRRTARSSPGAPSVFLGYYKNEEATAPPLVGRLAPLRRRRLPRRGRPPGRHRPPQGRDEARRRDAVLAAVHREPAQVLPLREGGGGGRQGPPVPHRHALHRHGRRREVGREEQALVHDLHRPLRQARGLRPGAAARSTR